MTWRGDHIVIVVGAVLLVAPLVVGAATAPKPVAPAGDGVAIVVGVQGPADRGMVVAYGPHGDERWRYTDAASYHDVTVLPNGSVLAAYAAEEQSQCGRYTPPCARTGYQIIDPTPQPHVVAEWSYPVRTIGNSEVHDVERIGGGAYVIVGMDRERLGTVRNGSVTWWWNASDYYDAPANPTRKDWLHMNDVDDLGDGRFLVSVRNANQLLVVERGVGVVNVINRGMNASKFRGQHNPQYLDAGAVLVADSSNDRVVELHKRGGEWRIAWALGKANGVRFAWPRDADRLADGTTLITDSRNHRVVRVTESGRVVQSWHTPKLPYDADVYSGEPLGGPRHSNAAAVPATGETEIPVFGQVAIGLEHAVGLPWYITEYHVTVMVVGAACLLVGVAARVYDRVAQWHARAGDGSESPF